ncbi:hypothetical protein V7128_01600 [Neobacillus vireti]|uniref:hypothetical protein n=1 Tax=Neobacillus vireti TaxID=220686 RepID=UPI002FFE113E
MKISIYRNGKEIGTAPAANVKMEVVNEPLRLGNTIITTFPKSRTIYVYLKDVIFNKDISNLDPFETYQFIVTHFKLPKGLRKPKKKRILNKYKKKYTYTGTWDYCQIRV